MLYNLAINIWDLLGPLESDTAANCSNFKLHYSVVCRLISTRVCTGGVQFYISEHIK